MRASSHAKLLLQLWRIDALEPDGLCAVGAREDRYRVAINDACNKVHPDVTLGTRDEDGG